jgi:hypothetical protein
MTSGAWTDLSGDDGHLTPLARGTGDGERIGIRVGVFGITLNYQMHIAHTTTATTNRKPQFRFILLLDKWSKRGTACPAETEWLSGSSLRFLAMQDPSTYDRYEILKDWTVQPVEEYQYTTGGNYFYPGCDVFGQISLDFPDGIDSEYSQAASDGDILNLQRNTLHLWGTCNDIPTGQTPKFRYRATFSYHDH